MIIERATVADVISWASAPGFPLPRVHYKSLLAQVVIADAKVLRETPDDAPLVIAGCVGLDRSVAGEVFFLAALGGLGRRLVGIHRIGRRWLAEEAMNWPAGLVCHVQPDNAHGQRLARALGFVPVGPVSGWEQWRYADGRRRESGQRNVQGAGHQRH